MALSAEPEAKAMTKVGNLSLICSIALAIDSITTCFNRVTSVTGIQVWKFPISPTALPTGSVTNNLAYYKSAGAAHLKNAETGVEYGLPEDGGVAAFVNGQLSWPVFNNR